MTCHKRALTTSRHCLPLEAPLVAAHVSFQGSPLRHQLSAHTFSCCRLSRSWRWGQHMLRLLNARYRHARIQNLSKNYHYSSYAGRWFITIISLLMNIFCDTTAISHARIHAQYLRRQARRGIASTAGAGLCYGSGSASFPARRFSAMIFSIGYAMDDWRARDDCFELDTDNALRSPAIARAFITSFLRCSDASRWPLLCPLPILISSTRYAAWAQWYLIWMERRYDDDTT